MKRLAAFLLSLLLWTSPIAASQNSIVMPLTGPLTMAQVMTLLNLGLNTMASTYSGPTPPAVSNGSPVVYQFWLDTSTSPRVLRIYDGTAWVPLGTLDDVSHAFSISVSSLTNDATGTTYTFADADKNTYKRFTNTAAVNATLPQAGASSQFLGGWFVDVRYTGNASLTITPTVSTIDGAASLTLTPGKSCRIYSTSTNYVTTCSLGTPTTSVLGGVFQMTAAASQYLTGVDATGTFTRSTIAASNLTNGTTGSGSVVLGTAPTITDPVITQFHSSLPYYFFDLSANAQGAAFGSLVVSDSYTAVAAPTNGILTKGGVKFQGSSSGSTQVNASSAASGTLTLPAATDQLVGRNTTDTLTNKTLTSPVINTPTGIVKGDVGLGNVDNTSDATKNAAVATLTNKTLTSPIINTGDINGGTADGLTSLGIRSTGSAFDIRFAATEVLTADRVLTWVLGDANRTVTLGGNVSTGGAFTLSGAFGTTFNVTGTTNVTFPTTGTLATLAGVETFTNKTLASPAITTPTGIVKGDVGLGNVDNTSDATKNAAVATLTNKTLTAPVINSPTGIVKGDVGLGNVDNTSDATKNAASVTLTNKTIASPIITGITDKQGVSKYTGISTPAQITATQNDYNPGSVICSTADTLRLDSNASQNVTGLAGGTSGCQLTIMNIGSNPIVLQDQNGGSTATNRFAFGADVTLAANTSLTIRYDNTSQRWRALVSPGAGGGGGGGVTSVACDGFGVQCSTITTTGTIRGNYPHPFMLGGM